MAIERLWVMWRDEANQRHRIGQLWRVAGGFRFAYEAPLPSAFHALTEFPELRGPDQPYEARHLFATFSERIPSPKRPDFAQFMAAWSVENPDDQLEILARGGGIQATDWLELYEWRAEDDDLSRPLFARVAGVTKWPGAPSATAGDRLELRREPGNQWDPHATELLLPGGLKLGYVPRPYTELVSAVLDSGAMIEAKLLAPLGFEGSYARWAFRLQRATKQTLAASA